MNHLRSILAEDIEYHKAALAAAELAPEASEAQAEVGRTLGEVHAFANAILSEEIHDIALALQTAEATATALRVKLKAAEQVAAFLPGGGARLSGLTVDQLNRAGPRDIAPSQEAIDTTAENLRAYHTELCSDATAVFEPTLEPRG